MANEQKSDLKIEWVPIESVKPYEKNAKFHSDEQVLKIATQISEVGWTQPIVVDRDLTIIAGHGRHMAAKALGRKEVPILIAHHLSPEKVKAARIADNKVAEAPWLNDVLRAEFMDMKNLTFDVPKMTGFDRPEFENLVNPKVREPRDSNQSKMVHTCPKCHHEFT